MARPSPLLSQHQLAEALLSPYGPAEHAIQVVQTFGEIDIEYAAVRKGAILLDEPHRAWVEVLGADRVEFLNRMITQDLKGFAAFSSRHAFWLSRKGRIDADLRLVNLPDRMLIDVDAFAAQRTVEGLSAYVITEDVTIVDRSDALHRLSLHGPQARAALAKVSKPVAGGGPGLADLLPNQSCVVSAAGVEIVVDRVDLTGEVGLGLAVPKEAVRTLYDQFLEAGGYANGHVPGGAAVPTQGELHLRPAGWAAFNTARIEAGTPVYYLDFGPDSLPAETGVLASRVSFTKGCYLGQEIVARMHALGAPKQQVVALRLPGPKPAPVLTDSTLDYQPPTVPQPITGAQVFAAPAGGVANGSPRPSDLGDPVGAITSSAISPMLGGVPVCLAVVKSKHAGSGTGLFVECEGELLPTSVQPRLTFWSRSAGPAQ